MTRRRDPTSTYRFGTSRREAHDATDFYARFAAPEISDDEVIDPTKDIDQVVCGDARSMIDVKDASVALVVTSPPYFAGKQYEADLSAGHVPSTYLDYLRLLEDVFAECVRKLEPGGRIAVNVANLGRRPYRSLSADVITILQDKLRLLLRGEIIWQKAKGASGNCAWGSFQSPANPVLRDLTERVVVASKGRFDRALTPRARHAAGLPHRHSLTRDEFMEATTDVWTLPPESATRIGHPAPFPVELPLRLIHLYTYVGDLVLDPFIGSGTTAVAAVRSGRHFVGYDLDEGYAAAARARIATEQARAVAPDTLCEPTHPVAEAIDRGASTGDLVSATLEAAGFAGPRRNERIARGVRADVTATDPEGGQWVFLVSGGLTTAPSGLRRLDQVWEVIGKAAVVKAAVPHSRVVVLSTTNATGEGRTALRTACGADGPLDGVVVVTGHGAVHELRRLRSG